MWTLPLFCENAQQDENTACHGHVLGHACANDDSWHEGGRKDYGTQSRHRSVPLPSSGPLPRKPWNSRPSGRGPPERFAILFYASLGGHTPSQHHQARPGASALPHPSLTTAFVHCRSRGRYMDQLMRLATGEPTPRSDSQLRKTKIVCTVGPVRARVCMRARQVRVSVYAHMQACVSACTHP